MYEFSIIVYVKIGNNNIAYMCHICKKEEREDMNVLQLTCIRGPFDNTYILKTVLYAACSTVPYKALYGLDKPYSRFFLKMYCTTYILRIHTGIFINK